MLGLYVKYHRFGIILPKRNVDAGLGRFAERLIVRGLDDTDDLTELLLSRQLKALAEGILVGPVAAGHGVVDDCDGGCAFAVVLVKVAAVEERDANG